MATSLLSLYADKASDLNKSIDVDVAALTAAIYGGVIRSPESWKLARVLWHFDQLREAAMR